MKTIQIKSPSAILVYQGKSYVALPSTLTFDQSYDAFGDRVSELAGEGTKILDRDGFRTYLLFVDGNESNQSASLPFGMWVVRYTLDPENASSIDRIYLAAEVA